MKNSGIFHISLFLIIKFTRCSRSLELVSTAEITLVVLGVKTALRASMAIHSEEFLVDLVNVRVAASITQRVVLYTLLLECSVIARWVIPVRIHYPSYLIFFT